MKAENKQKVLDTIEDLVTNFVHYDREEDEQLSVEALESYLEDGTINLERIFHHFKICLGKAFPKQFEE